MNIDFQEILKELEFRVPNGIIDLNENSQVTTLVDILRENGVDDANELAQRARVIFGYVNEAVKKSKSKGKVGTDFMAFSKEGEKRVYFKTKDAMNAAIKAGTHITPKQKADNDRVKEKAKSQPKAKKQEPKKLSGAQLKTNLEKRKENDTIVDKNVRNSIKQFENFLTDKQKLAIKLEQKKRVLELKKLDTLAASFKKLPKEIQNTASAIFAKGQIYEGRENSGIGKNRLGYLDVKTLNSNRDYLLKSYGDGSPENIRKFVRNSRKIKVTEEYVESSYNLLPEALQTALNGKGKTGDAGKNKHFLGYVKNDGSVTSDRSDPDIKKDKKGNLEVKRGNPGNRDRGKFVWRCILEQGGQDPYSGLPLDLSAIDLEHVCAFDNKDRGKPTVDDYLHREHDDNIVICATNLNQKKSNLSMRKFYEMHVDPQVGKSEASFKKESETYETINEVASQTDQKAALAVQDGKLKKGYTDKTLKELFDNDDKIYLNAKTEFKKVAETDEDKKAIAGLNSEIGRGVLMALGLGRGLIDKSGRRTIKLSSDNIYRGFLLSMAEQPDKQEKFKAGWEAARKVGNSDKYRLQGKGQQAMIKYLIDNKFISDKVLNDPIMGKVFRNALNEVYDYDNDVYILIY